MSSLGPWTVTTGAEDASVGSAARVSQESRLFGKDIWYNAADERGANTQTSNTGDWLLVEGRECLRQAIIRRIITNPGDWQTLPDYGAGAPLFVKLRNTPSAIAELKSRIKGQLLRDRRIVKVEGVAVEQITNGIKISVVIQPIGRAQRAEPLTASVELTA